VRAGRALETATISVDARSGPLGAPRGAPDAQPGAFALGRRGAPRARHPAQGSPKPSRSASGSPGAAAACSGAGGWACASGCADAGEGLAAMLAPLLAGGGAGGCGALGRQARAPPRRALPYPEPRPRADGWQECT